LGPHLRPEIPASEREHERRAAPYVGRLVASVQEAFDATGLHGAAVGNLPGTHFGDVLTDRYGVEIPGGFRRLVIENLPTKTRPGDFTVIYQGLLESSGRPDYDLWLEATLSADEGYVHLRAPWTNAKGADITGVEGVEEAIQGDLPFLVAALHAESERRQKRRATGTIEG